MYVVCIGDSGYKIMPLENSQDPKFVPNDKICQPFIPRTETDLKALVKTMANSFGNQTNRFFGKSVKFWTDYVRVNDTHYWSELGNSWWSQCRSSELSNPDFFKFSSVVIIDGHRNIRNAIDRYKTGCICIGKVLLIISQIYTAAELAHEMRRLTEANPRIFMGHQGSKNNQHLKSKKKLEVLGLCYYRCLSCEFYIAFFFSFNQSKNRCSANLSRKY